MPSRTRASRGAAPPSRAQRYQDRADYLRAMARRTKDAEVRSELQRMAREFERRATRTPRAGSGEAAP